MQAVRTAPQAQSPIAEAMATPAAPPASMRGVVKPILARQPEVEPEDDAQADAGEPAAVEGMVPDEMNAMFSDLMKNP